MGTLKTIKKYIGLPDRPFRGSARNQGQVFESGGDVILRETVDETPSAVMNAQISSDGTLAEATFPTPAEDPLGISTYARGLTSFILNSNTPMTISIQGDWGVGKTTMMEMIRHQLVAKNKIIPIWFNTWQYSQFNLADQLPILLLSRFISDVASAGDDNTMEAQELMKGVLRGVLKIGGPAAKLIGLDLDAERLEQRLLELFVGPHSVLDQFAKLQNKLEQQVKRSLEKKQAQKVVTFIDDLDRLDPEKAVELLGAMKVFLDVPGCVFVLACDYDVIRQGVEKKFKYRESQSSGKSFFDKIFQLSFRMPVGRYNHQKYLASLLEAADLSYKSEDLPQYLELLRHSVGFNPRNVKRLVNNLTLLNTVLSEGRSDAEDNQIRQKILFATGCMESAYNQIYQVLLANRESLEKMRGLLQDFGNLEGINQLAQSGRFSFESEEKEAILRSLPIFIGSFVETLQLNDDQELSDEELNLLREVLEFTSLTAMRSVETPQQDLSRDPITIFCRAVKDEIRMKLGINAPNAFSKKAVLGHNNSRDYRLWFKPEGAKRAWSQWRISYGLDFDRNKHDELSLNLIVWNEAKNYGLQPEQIEQLKQLSIVRNREFDYKKLDDGGVSVERNLGPVQFQEVDEAASHLARLIEATRDLFDVPTEVRSETQTPRTGP